MSKKVKLFILITSTVAAVLFGLFAYISAKGPAVLASRLPAPSGSDPYVLFEAKEEYYPVSLSALLTEGQYAFFSEGSSGSDILSLAKNAKECAVLIENSRDDIIDVFAAVRLDREAAASLSKGELPPSWEKILGPVGAVIKTGDKNSWEIRTRDSSLFYGTEKDIVLIANDREPFSGLIKIRSGSAKGISKKIWKKERSWPAHMILSDGGLLFAGEERKGPLTLHVSWRSRKADKESGKAGEAVWRIEGLDKRISPIFLKSLRPKTWDTANSIIPDPLLVSAGINLPDLKGSPKDWPFPLGTIGELGASMGLEDEQIQKILSGETIFSVGGYNKILWFSLPGIMVQFTGDKTLLAELIDAFWNKLLFGAEPKPLTGFDLGGSTSLPFSVVGAAKDNTAVLGLLSPESLKEKGSLGTFLKDNEKAVAWLVADLPKVGAALGDMTKMNAFMNEPDINDDGYYGSDTEDIFQPDSSFSPFDQGISNSFGNVLKRMGRALIVWETAESGRISWYIGHK